jgi:stage IV sporulation protein FB
MRLPGSLTIARPFGVPVRIHWSVPLCALLSGLSLTGGFHFVPGAVLAYTLLVLIHEAGHAFVVRRVGARALALDVTGFGGLCWWRGPVTPIQRACIAWGGIWAQMIVLAVTGALVLLLGPPPHWFAAQMVDVAITTNLWLMGLNLLPIPPLDGKDAWTLFPLLWRRRLAARRSRPPALGAARVRIVVPQLDRRQIARPSAADALDELRDDADLTPEAQAVLERVRDIVAREGARAPGSTRTSGSGDDGRGAG